MVIFYMVVTYHDVINAFHLHYLIWASCLVSWTAAYGHPDADSILSAIAEERGKEGSLSANIFRMLSLPPTVGF